MLKIEYQLSHVKIQNYENQDNFIENCQNFKIIRLVKTCGLEAYVSAWSV